MHDLLSLARLLVLYYIASSPGHSTLFCFSGCGEAPFILHRINLLTVALLSSLVFTLQSLKKRYVINTTHNYMERKMISWKVILSLFLQSEELGFKDKIQIVKSVAQTCQVLYIVVERYTVMSEQRMCIV